MFNTVSEAESCTGNDICTLFSSNSFERFCFFYYESFRMYQMKSKIKCLMKLNIRHKSFTLQFIFAVQRFIFTELPLVFIYLNDLQQILINGCWFESDSDNFSFSQTIPIDFQTMLLHKLKYGANEIKPKMFLFSRGNLQLSH